MKKLPKLLSLEKVIFIQRVSCTLLVCLMLLSSFGGIFVVPFDDDFSEFFTSVDPDDREEFEDGVFIKLDFFSATSSIFKLIYFANANGVELDRAYHEVVEQKSGHSLSVRANAIAYLLIEGYDSDITVGIYFTIALFSVISLHVILVISAIILLTKHRAPRGKQDEHTTYKGVMNVFRKILCQLPLPFILISFAPRLDFGASLWEILILCAIGLVINISAPIFKNYTASQRKYAIMIQTVSILGIVNFAVFCISLIRSNMIPKAVALFDGKSLSGFFSMFENGKVDIDEILFSFAGLTIFLSLLCAHRALAHNLCRIGFTTTRMKNHDYTAGDAYISTVIAPNVAFFVYLLLIGSNAEMIFYPDELPYFITLVVCAALMTATEVIIVVFKETVCLDCGRGGRDTVLEGNTYEAQIEKHQSDAKINTERFKLLKFFVS